MDVTSMAMLVLLFFSYSFMGWSLEVGCKLVELKRFVNRGFLIGPYCPIYGFGCLGITILLQKYSHDPLALFIMSMVMCSILEYVTSYLLEKLFHARWWDYSRRKYNINGRVCLETMVPFGLLGLGIMYFVNPMLVQFYTRFSETTLFVLAIVFLVLFLADIILSFSIMFKLKIQNIPVGKDSTEEITKYVRDVLANRSFFTRRLMKAFPNMKVKNSFMKKREEEK